VKVLIYSFISLLSDAFQSAGSAHIQVGVCVCVCVFVDVTRLTTYVLVSVCVCLMCLITFISSHTHTHTHTNITPSDLHTHTYTHTHIPTQGSTEGSTHLRNPLLTQALIDIQGSSACWEHTHTHTHSLESPLNPSLVALAAGLVSDVISNDPSVVSYVHQSGLAKVCLCVCVCVCVCVLVLLTRSPTHEQ
jgi:hypothetical protein